MRTVAVAFLLTLAPGPAALAAGNDGPAAWWGFDEGNGKVLHDKSGNNNQGEIHGAEWVESGNGHALRFDGVDDRVDFGNHDSLVISKALTIEFRISVGSTTSHEPGIIGTGMSGYALTCFKDSVCFYIGGGGNMLCAPLVSGGQKARKSGAQG